MVSPPKVMILHRDLAWLGGIEAYYGKIKEKFSPPADHFIIGRRPGESGRWTQSFRMLGDYLRFIRTLRKGGHDIVHVNPSLEFNAMFREGIFLVLARLMGRKTLVFIRGWQKPFEQTIDRYTWAFRLLYGKTDAFIVLSEEFRSSLQRWGIRKPIHCEVTIADDALLSDFDIGKEISGRLSRPWKILFASRIMRVKGIYEAIDAVSIVQKKFPDTGLVVAGNGEELEAAQSYVREQQIPHIEFVGYLRGQPYFDQFKEAQVLCFPTQHGEGMPNVVVEAMALGLPVVTRKVGGVADFFVNERHGFVTTGTEPAEFASYLLRLIEDKKLYASIARHNYEFAREKFLASSAARRLEGIYRSL